MSPDTLTPPSVAPEESPATPPPEAAATTPTLSPPGDWDAATAAGWQEETEPETTTTAATQDLALLEPGEEVSPEQIRSHRPLWQGPLPKIALMGCGVFLALNALLSFVGAGRDRWPDKASAVATAPTPDSEATQLQAQVEDLKTKNALQSQAIVVHRPQPTPPQPQPEPRVQRVPTPPQPRQVRAAVIRPATVPPVVRPAFRQVPPPQSRAIAFQPPLLSRPPLPPKPVTRSTPQDPMERWLAASQLGSYVGGEPTFSSTSAAISASPRSVQSAIAPSGIRGGRGTLMAGPASVTPSAVVTGGATTTPGPSSIPVSYPVTGTQIQVGSRAEARLETPIAWSGKASPTQKLVLQLEEDLPGTQGKTGIPQGSYLIASVKTADSSGLLEVVAIAAIVDGRERPLPEGAVRVLGRGGKPLQASIQGTNQFARHAGTFLLSGISEATDLINRPTTQATYASEGGFLVTTENPESNLAAGFLRGGTQSLVGQMQRQQQQQLQRSQAGSPVFVVKQGASLQVFVNQSFAF